MKKIFTILSVATLATTINAQTQENFIQNGSFENGFVEPWKAGWNASYTAPALKTDGGQDGVNYVEYSGITATTGFVQEVAIDANTEYTFAFWYKATGGGKDARLWSSFLDASGKGVYLGASATSDPLRNNNGYLTTTTDWKQVTVTFTSPANAVKFQAHVRAYKGATANFDNFILVKGTLSTVDFSMDKKSLVKTTVVTDKIEFLKNAEVKIFNANGQIVKTAKVGEGTALDVTHLSTGVYILTGVVNGETFSQKIIKK